MLKPLELLLMPAYLFLVVLALATQGMLGTLRFFLLLALKPSGFIERRLLVTLRIIENLNAFAEGKGEGDQRADDHSNRDVHILSANTKGET